MSQMLEETHFKARDGKWYISILPYEDAAHEDFHGPFDSQGRAAMFADEELPSTSGLEIDESGFKSPPTVN